MNALWKFPGFAAVGLFLAALLAVPATALAQTPSARGPVTFAKDVAPILQRSCQVCHRPGSIAPMSLLTYQEVRPWARAIKQRTGLREMPPWHIDRNVGISKFKDDRSLSDEEIATIATWVDAGAPLGNPADMPPPRKFEDVDKWHIGTPDLIVSLPKDQIVPAAGPDKWLDILVETGLKEDRWLKAVETKPSKGFKVVHHSVQTMTEPDGSIDDSDNPRGAFLNEYALGKNGDIFPEGAARLMKAGSKINFNLHLHSIGEEMGANVEVGLKFYPKGYVPKYIENSEGVGRNQDLDIPANTDNTRSEGYFTLTKPARILSFQPHMHNRGKSMCVEAIYPPTGTPATGNTQQQNRVETLSCVDKYQFAWHVNYHYEDDVQPLLPAGTVLHVIGIHNNTAANKFNPDPDNLVTYGARTIDDMSFAWMSWYYLSDAEYKQQVEARQAAKSKTTSN